MPTHCSIPYCESRKDAFIFYRFPNTPDIREIWRQKCNMQKASQSMVACERHFFNSDFVMNSKGHRRLKKGK